MPRRAAWRQWMAGKDGERTEFARWFDNLARSSTVTAKENARVLHRYCRECGMTPFDLAEQARENRDQVERDLQDFLSRLHQEGKPGGEAYSPGYLRTYPKVVKSWLRHFGIRLVRKFNTGNPKERPTLSDERPPTPEELRAILGSGTLRKRVAVSLMGFSGLRPGVLGNNDASDGLRLKDLPDLELDDGEPRFGKRPAQVVVRASLSKARHRYATFLTRNGCQHVLDYLKARVAGGEELGPEAPVYRIDPSWQNHPGRESVNFSPFMRTITVSGHVRDALRPRFTWRPYVIRRYFSARMLQAENAGKVSHAFWQYWMGHEGDMTARYATNTGRLNEEMVEEMRAAYVRCEPFLTGSGRGTHDAKETVREFARDMARSLGLDPGDIRIEKTPEEELHPQQEIELLTKQIAKRVQGGRSTNGYEHKVVKGDGALVDHLDDGWELVERVSGEKFLLRC